MGSGLSRAVSQFIPRTFKALLVGSAFSPEGSRDQHSFDTSAGREEHPRGALNTISCHLRHIPVLRPLLFCSAWPSPHLSLHEPKMLLVPRRSSLSRPGEGQKSVSSSRSEARGAQVSTGGPLKRWLHLCPVLCAQQGGCYHRHAQNN